MFKPPIRRYKNSKSFYNNFTINGERVRCSLKTDDKQLAYELSLAMYNRMRALEINPNVRDKMTVDAIFGKYWIEEGQYKVSGQDAIKPWLLRFRDFFGGATMWHHLRDKDISAYVNRRRQEFVPIIRNMGDGSKRVSYTKRKISHSTINKEIAKLGRINNLALDMWNVEPAQFSAKKHKLVEKQIEKRYFTRDDEQKIYAALPDYWADAFRFCVLTGLRAKHLFPRKRYRFNPIKRKDIDIENQILIVRMKSHTPDGKLSYKPLISEAFSILMRRGILDMKPDDVVFTYPDGHKYAGEPLGNYTNALHKAMEAAGFHRELGDGMHLTRHTHGTWLSMAGAPLDFIQDSLDHASSKTTRIYEHIAKAQKKVALENFLVENRQNENHKKIANDL